MKRLAALCLHSLMSRPLTWAATFSVVGLMLVAASTLRGCANEHSRPRGHIDITFDISPSGDALVFNAAGEGGRDLFLLDLKASRVTRIAATPDYEVDPKFSPDGKSIIYAAGKPGDRADHIFVRSLDGTTVRQLTREDANDASPAFSPDGSLIAFTRDRSYNWGGLASNWDAGALFAMKADGTGLRQLIGDESVALNPHFSPDGRTILFCGENGVSTVGADGTEPPRPLGVPYGSEASYSPGGHSITFSLTARYAPDSRIFVARADGTSPRRLPDPGESDNVHPIEGCFRPHFTPDGRRIVFFLESWPSGLTGVSKESLWEIDLKRGRSREIAGYDLFDDPLNWRPKSQGPATNKVLRP